jgi:hypothetical protein
VNFSGVRLSEYALIASFQPGNVLSFYCSMLPLFFLWILGLTLTNKGWAYDDEYSWIGLGGSRAYRSSTDPAIQRADSFGDGDRRDSLKAGTNQSARCCQLERDAVWHLSGVAWHNVYCYSLSAQRYKWVFC